MNILVTGGAGYIGSHVVKQLIEQTDHSLFVLDNFSTGHKRTIDTLDTIAAQLGKKALTFYQEDLKNFAAIEALFQSVRFDAIIHFAASIIVPESVEHPLKYYMNNTVNTTHLISVAKRYGVRHFIFSSTAAVYGEPSTAQVSETTPTNPINPYGRSKLMSEQVLIDTSLAHEDFTHVILRYFNVAGADMACRIGQSFPNATHLIKVSAQTALGKRKKMMIFGDDFNTPDGTGVRDYIHVDDLASAHLCALEYLAQGERSNIFNVGYGRGFSVKEVIETMRSVSGVDFPADIAPRRVGDSAMLISDNTKIRSTLTWKPIYDDLRLICESALAWERQIDGL